MRSPFDLDRFGVKGYMLVEVLLSMSITIIVVMALWSGSVWLLKQSYLVQSWLDIFETQLWLKHLIQDEVSRAGYTPCLSLQKLLIDPLVKAYEVYPHELIVSRMDEQISVGKIINARTLELIQTNDKFLLIPGQVYLMADCFQGELIKIANVQHKDLKLLVLLTKPLVSSVWEEQVFFGKWIHESFKVKNGMGLTITINAKHTSVLTPRVKSIVFNEIVPGSLDIKLYFDDKQTQIIHSRVRM